MNKIICITCEREMKPVENGVTVSECDNDLEPYKIWHADLLECPVCKTRVISRFADRPFLQRPDDRLVEESVQAEYRFQ